MYVALRATNGAGLHTTVFSSGLTVDLTPPVAGYVHDGLPVNGVPADSQFQVLPPAQSILFRSWGGGCISDNGVVVNFNIATNGRRRVAVR